MSICLYRHVSTHLSHHQATIRTIYAYKLTVPILGSQTANNVVHEWYLTVIRLEVAIYNIDTVFCLFYLCFIDANAVGFFGLWCISRAGSASVCFAVLCFCFPWLRRIMSVLFGSVYIFDNPSLGLLSYIFPSCYFGPGWLCAGVFLCIFSYRSLMMTQASRNMSL
jgi:hypothetical protein